MTHMSQNVQRAYDTLAEDYAKHFPDTRIVAPLDRGCRSQGLRLPTARDTQITLATLTDVLVAGRTSFSGFAGVPAALSLPMRNSTSTP